MFIQKYLFRVYYDGYNYTGFQRQPNGFTVENLVEISLIRSKLITSFSSNKYISISRTDAKVSALSNIFGIYCFAEPNLSRINNYLPNNNTIKIWDFIQVASNFNIRSSLYKIYSYYFPKAEFDEIKDIERIFQFEGKHDFQSFIKNDGSGEQNSYSSILSITIKKFYLGYLLIIKGDKFGREQIRRMIGFIIDTEYSKISPKVILESKQKFDIQPANPEHLYLIDIKYSENLKWKYTDHFNINGRKSNLHNPEILALLHKMHFLDKL